MSFDPPEPATEKSLEEVTYTLLRIETLLERIEALVRQLVAPAPPEDAPRE